ncbi:hypothetical protein D3C72_2294370 [compost metagenome]
MRQPVGVKQALSQVVINQAPWVEPGSQRKRRARQHAGLVHPGDQVAVVGAQRHAARAVMDHDQIGTPSGQGQGGQRDDRQQAQGVHERNSCKV